MIEQILLDYLRTRLEIPVHMEIPEKPPLEFIVLEKVGSSKTNKISSATFAIQSYAGTLLRAAEWNEAVKAAIEEADSLDEVCAVRLNTDYNFTDTSTKRYRYQAVYDITHY